MEVFKFLELNVGIVGVLLLVVFIYLIFLINRRRRSKFLHNDNKNNDTK